MNFEFEKFLPIAVREESLPKPEGERILEMPSWDCFCCHDIGLISPHLVELVMPGYNHNRDRMPMCQRCNKGHRWIHLKENIDMRISAEQCEKLDQYERIDWQETLKNQFEKFKKNKDLEKDIVNKINKLAASKSLRKRGRTLAEESEAQYRHDLARSDRYETISESKLLFDSDIYQVEDSPKKADLAWNDESAFPNEEMVPVNS